MECCNIANPKVFGEKVLRNSNLKHQTSKINQFARVAELVDAADSKSAVRKDVLVRFQSRALKQLRLLFLF